MGNKEEIMKKTDISVCNIALKVVYCLSHEVPKGPYGPRKNLTPKELLGAFRGTCNRNEFFPLNPELTEPQPSIKKTAKYCTKCVSDHLFLQLKNLNKKILGTFIICLSCLCSLHLVYVI